jgi:perosamine synthetase
VHRPRRFLERGATVIPTKSTPGSLTPDARTAPVPSTPAVAPRPSVGVPWSEPDLGEEERRAVLAVLDSGWLGMGPKTKEFERGICEYTGAREAIVVNNGTSALVAALLANGIGPGDEVLVPTYTFAATVNSVLAVGAKPVLLDCDPQTFNVTPEIVESELRDHPQARALLFVDVAGQPCDLDALTELARRRSLVLIEDAAEAFGAGYRGRRVGASEHTTIFSFHIAKQMTSVEGGAIVTHDREVASRARLVRSHGEGSEKYVHVAFGLNFRPTDLLSAIGTVQLRKVDRYLGLRNDLARRYRDFLAPYLRFQEVPAFVTQPTWMIFMALATNREERDAYVRWLSAHGIDTRIPWPPVHAQPYYVRQFGASMFPSADDTFARVLSLPMGNGLKMEQVQSVVECSLAFFQQRGR